MNLLLQGVPTSLEYAKCNALFLRNVCERSELRLQKKDWLFLSNFSPIIICSNLFSKLSEIGEKWL